MFRYLLVLLGAAGLASGAHASVLAPVITGTFTGGNGVNSAWVQVEADWQSTIFPTETWATGIWGIADALTVLGMTEQSDPDAVYKTLSGLLPKIDYGNQAFIDEWGPTWGTPALAPLFNGALGEYQDNFAVKFTGFISITEPGQYNFGVLNDDGFRFTLMGDGNSPQIARDGLNPRDRNGFGEDFTLAAGLYGFELIGYDRLEAGVINLAWSQDGGPLETVPQSHLFSDAVPLPSSIFLIISGLSALALHGWRRPRRS
jgi:hypothetical protein